MKEKLADNDIYYFSLKIISLDFNADLKIEIISKFIEVKNKNTSSQKVSNR